MPVGVIWVREYSEIPAFKKALHAAWKKFDERTESPLVTSAWRLRDWCSILRWAELKRSKSSVLHKHSKAGVESLKMRIVGIVQGRWFTYLRFSIKSVLWSLVMWLSKTATLPIRLWTLVPIGTGSACSLPRSPTSVCLSVCLPTYLSGWSLTYLS